MAADMDNLWRNETYAVNGFDQFCRDWRPRETPYLPMLALHGSLTQSGMWIALAQAAGAIRMACPDQRGFGLSGDPGGDACAAFAADAMALAQHLFAGRYVIMGHSFACAIALEVACAAARDVAAVVLVDPVVRVAAPPAASPSPPPPQNFATREAAERYFRDTEEGVWTDGALRRFVQDIMMHGDGNGPWRFPYAPTRLRRLRAFTASAAGDYKLLAKAAAVRCPVLVFRGGMSNRFPAAAEAALVAAFASRPELIVCPDSGHFPTATEPDIVLAALQRFLAGVATS
jgi:pimeloyl-ACP methyl ester carboxylesterase